MMLQAIDFQITHFESKDWNRIIAQLPDPHLLQTWEWGAFKSSYGWDPTQLTWSENEHIVAAALVLKRSLDVPLLSRYSSILYVPKGPIMDWRNIDLRNKVLSDLGGYAKSASPLFIKIDPDIVLGTGLPGIRDEENSSLNAAITSALKQQGWRYSAEQIQFKNTVLIELLPDEETLLSNMKQKTRYNIRLASRKGVTVRPGNIDDFEQLFTMYAETSLRDRFAIRSEQYYRSAWGMFIPVAGHTKSQLPLDGQIHPVAEPLIAEVDGKPVAAVIIYRFAGKAWYMYGMSRAVHREKMPNYLLQWEAMRRAKAAGCHTYDLWGAPDAYEESDPLWRVYQFKLGFGGTVVRHVGAWDLPIKPAYYKIYGSMLPRLLDLMRILGRKSTRQSIMI